MKRIQTAIVIGAGIAGPVMALALDKAGITATVYESYDNTADGIGGTLALAPNGLTALHIVAADTEVTAIATPMHRTAMSIGGKKVDLPSLPDLPPLQVVNRSKLHRVLHDKAVEQGIGIEYGKRLIDVKEEPNGITALFADGTSATADVLIGADGVRSTVRTLIDPQAPGPNYTGLLGVEALARHEVDSDPGTMTFAFGKNAYYLYWPEPGGGTRWGINLPQERPMTLTEARAIPNTEWMRVLQASYGQDDPGQDLVRTTDVEGLQVIGSMHIMPSVPNWYRGPMVLIGDAVHAPSNSSGQGASLAIESAIQLARCLRDIPDLPSAFATYERLRRARVEKVAARAAKLNHAKAPGPVARMAMKVLMPILMKIVMNPERMIGREQR
jgi:2-polyprenyl-6-methoxyphenol hydroxylase-like FAD-dependent oxidoreductase